ncbi:MAG TPA: PAS domain S-box protein [Anaeromyxobacter sp.]|nr:PAS domain S-box protein [Anaeromyxobacter sp.]
MSERAATPDAGLDVRVLGKLILAESALHALPDLERIASFLCEAACAIPGVSGAALCSERRLVRATGPWPAPASPCDRPGGGCATCVHQPPGSDATIHPLRTATADYGQLALLLSDRAAAAPYLPFLQNVANVAATSAENREQQRRLLELDGQLQDKVHQLVEVQGELSAAQRALEATVADRTTALRTSNELLRQSQSWLLLAQEAAGVGIWEWRAADGKVTLSGADAVTFGVARGEPVPLERILSLVRPEDVGALRAAVRRSIAKGTRVDLRFRVTRATGETRWLLAVGRPEYDPGGGVLRVVGIDVDVTERRQLEESLLQAAKLESVGRLAGGLAHDFNNVLTVIIAAVQAAEQADTEEERADALGEIRSSADRAAALTRQLLLFSRRRLAAPRVVEVNGEIRALTRMLARLVGESVEVVADLAPDLWPVVIDPGQLGQVLTNLAANARDAMPHGGRLAIETRNRRLDAGAATAIGLEEPGDWVAIEVADSGEGMSPRVMSHLFEPFFTTKGEGRGTGLGLATSYGIVAQAGGRIQVTSEVGRGSRLTIWLPRAPAGARAGEEFRERPEEVPSGNETVLLVDDDHSVRRTAARGLERLGYRVLEAATPSEALAVAAKHLGPIHALVTDVVMPGQSGLELASALLGANPHLAVLFVSGHAPEALGAEQPFLAKPFTTGALARRLRELLDRSGAGPAPSPAVAWPRFGLDPEERSAARFQLSQSVAHIGNWEIELATGTVWASDEAFRIYGLPVSPGHNLPLSAVQARPLPEDRPALDQALKELMTHGIPYDRRFRIRRADDGAVRIVHSLAQVVRAPAGPPLLVAGTVQDVTEWEERLQRMVDALAASEERARLAFERAADAILIIDGTLAVTQANERAVALTGRPLADLAGRSLRSLFSEAELAAKPFRVEPVLAGDTVRSERLLRRADGGEVAVETTTRRLTDGLYQMILRDVGGRGRRGE